MDCPRSRSLVVQESSVLINKVSGENNLRRQDELYYQLRLLDWTGPQKLVNFQPIQPSDVVIHRQGSLFVRVRSEICSTGKNRLIWGLSKSSFGSCCDILDPRTFWKSDLDIAVTFSLRTKQDWCKHCTGKTFLISLAVKNDCWTISPQLYGLAFGQV